MALRYCLVAAGVFATGLWGAGYKIRSSHLNQRQWRPLVSLAVMGRVVLITTSIYGVASAGNHTEVGVTYINLPKVHYADQSTPLRSGDSLAENFLIPTLHWAKPLDPAWAVGIRVSQHQQDSQNGGMKPTPKPLLKSLLYGLWNLTPHWLIRSPIMLRSQRC